MNQLAGFTVVSAATVGLASVFTAGAQSVTGTAITLNGPTYQSANAGGTLGFTGVVTLGGSVTVATASATVSFSSTVDAAAAGVQGLAVAVGTSSVTPVGLSDPRMR